MGSAWSSDTRQLYLGGTVCGSGVLEVRGHLRGRVGGRRSRGRQKMAVSVATLESRTN